MVFQHKRYLAVIREIVQSLIREKPEREHGPVLADPLTQASLCINVRLGNLSDRIQINDAKYIIKIVLELTLLSLDSIINCYIVDD